jgi:hypothetical protein
MVDYNTFYSLRDDYTYVCAENERLRAENKRLEKELYNAQTESWMNARYEAYFTEKPKVSQEELARIRAEEEADETPRYCSATPVTSEVPTKVNLEKAREALEALKEPPPISPVASPKVAKSWAERLKMSLKK